MGHVKKPIEYATVPAIFPDGGTVLILGSGPSLAKADVDYARDKVDGIIAVNDTYKYAPDALCLYAADGHWWDWHKGAKEPHKVGKVSYPAFTGRFKYTLQKREGISLLKRGPARGLSLDPSYVATGYNSVYQAINVAVHFGATRVLLLGVDMHGGHFFGHHPNHSHPPFNYCLTAFQTLVEPLRAAGVEVINCSRQTALTCFPRQSLESVLPVIAESIAV